jgi:diaminopimelate epimerase
MRLAKAHGLGNDFLLVEAGVIRGDVAAWARRLCDRHVGMGADGLVLYALTQAGPSMRLVNADGSPAEISGNGVRCLAAHLVARNAVPARHVVATGAGPRAVEVEPVGGGRFRVATDLGVPILASRDIPVALEPPQERVIEHPLEVMGRIHRITASSLGNPHCAVFTDAPPDDALLRSLGPALESHPFFPHKSNVEFVTVVSPGELRVRMWERGAGLTRSSGTGSASAVVAAVLTGRAARTVRVACDGGSLEVEWPEGGSVRQRGEVELLFEGEWLLAEP